MDSSLGFFVESFRGFEEESFDYSSYPKFDQIESKRPEDKSVDVFEPEPWRAVEPDQFDYLVEFSSSIDLLAVPIDEPISVPVPDLPIWVEPFSSFPSSNPIILSDMFDFIKVLPSVEARCLLPKNHKIECSVYIDNASATFQVNLYKGKSEGQFVVELQRLSGCCIACSKVMNQILGKFQNKQERRKFAARDIELDDSLSQVALTGELAENLISMIQGSAGSEGSDPREGFRLLCEVTGNCNSHPMLVQACKGLDKLADLIKSGINSGDVETERYACIVLANLCCGGSGQSRPDSVSKFQSEIQKQVVELFDNLGHVLTDDNGSLGRDEAKRQVLRCVNSLSPDLDKDVKAKHGKLCGNLSSARLGDLSESAKASFARFLEVQ
jgi:hypothetical protein